MRDLCVAAAFAICIAAPGALAQSGPSVGHPLSPICDFICGGPWKASVPPAPDQFNTTYSFDWSGDGGVIRGTIATTGGVAGILAETHVTFAYDAGKEILTAHVETEGKPPIDGIVVVTWSGFKEILVSPEQADQVVIVTYGFYAGAGGADMMTVSADAGGPDNVLPVSEGNYQRAK